MKKSGSITVFTSLFLAVFLLVFQVLLQSVQIGGGRVQAETGVEEGLYSVFAGYDRELLERYHVFMVDGSYGTGVWKPECMYQTVKNVWKRVVVRMGQYQVFVGKICGNVRLSRGQLPHTH